MLWSAIGGNVSRLSGQTIYPKKDVSIEGCPREWNVTLGVVAAENSQAPTEGLDWYFLLTNLSSSTIQNGFS